jgi:hypothetical protein
MALGERCRQAPWRALRHRNFRLYFAGQCVSLMGTWIQQVALSWLASTPPASSVRPWPGC